MPKENGKKYRVQGYRKEWERESWARGWLSSAKHHEGKAYCLLCDKVLAPGKSELIGHSKTTTHVKRSKTVTETGSTSPELALNFGGGHCRTHSRNVDQKLSWGSAVVSGGGCCSRGDPGRILGKLL